MRRPDWTLSYEKLFAATLGGMLVLCAAGAGAESSIRGGKARIVTSPAEPGSHDVSGYYVPYVTGPSGARVPVMQVPGSVTVVPRSLMDDQQARTLGQALRNVPGVFVGR